MLRSLDSELSTSPLCLNGVLSLNSVLFQFELSCFCISLSIIGYDDVICLSVPWKIKQIKFVCLLVRRLLSPNSGSFCEPFKFGSDGFSTWGSKLGMRWNLCHIWYARMLMPLCMNNQSTKMKSLNTFGMHMPMLYCIWGPSRAFFHILRCLQSTSHFWKTFLTK